MAKKKLDKQKKKLGAPLKRENEKIRADHLRQDQWDRMVDEAAIRNIPVWAFIRNLIDWGITALDTKRGDVDASKLFDGVMSEESEKT